MEIYHFFDPVKSNLLDDIARKDKQCLVNQIQINTKNSTPGNLAEFDIAIIDVAHICHESGPEHFDNVRKSLYQLYTGKRISIVDLGTVKAGKTKKDSVAAIVQVIILLLEAEVLPIILGGDDGLIKYAYKAYESLAKAVNIASVNSRIELSEGNEGNSSLHNLILDKSTCLFNFSNLGYQTYLVNEDHLVMLNKLLFDSMRLGDLRANIKEAEPVLRDSDIVFVHLNSIKKGDAPAQINGSPNGFTSDEACIFTRYAGLSDKVSFLGLLGFEPEFDINNQTAELLAQMIWYFIDGFYQRKKDFPYCDLKEYKKFSVSLSELNESIVFYKSPASDRWWLEVSINKNGKKRNIIVACSYDDYLKACNQIIPDRWWKTFQKIAG